MSKKIAIIDYSLGNMFSVQQALAHFGYDSVVTGDRQQIKNAHAVILPGVGAFGEAMSNLDRMDLVQAIHETVQAGKQFMGICLGLQLLFDSSEEFGHTKGLGLVKGTIRKFSFDDRQIKVPQMGWNRIGEPAEGRWKDTPLETVKRNEHMYFVHSFYAVPSETSDKLCETTYGGVSYCSAVKRDNVFATQFHPEKSAAEGLKIYKNWLDKI